MVLTYDKQNLRIPFKILKKKNQVRLTITKKRVSKLKKIKTISTISKRSISISLPVKKDSNKFRLQLASPKIAQEIRTHTAVATLLLTHLQV